MIKKFFKNLINKKDNQEINNSTIKAVAECPICGNTVLENGDTWGCIGVLSGDCHFSMSNRLNGKKIDINTLIKYKQMDEFKHIQAIIQGAQKVKEDAYNQNDRVETNKVQETQETQVTQNVQEVQEVQEAQVVQKTQDVQGKTKLYSKKSKTDNDDFFKKARKLKYGCPCGSPVYRYGQLAKCSNPDCGFEIKTQYADRKFLDDEVAELLAHRVSRVKKFTNTSNNQVFKGRVFIDFDDNYNLLPKYKYVSNLDTLDEKYKSRLFAPDKGSQTEIPLSTLLNNQSKKDSKKSSTYNSESNNTTSNTNNKNDSINNNKDNESYEEKYYRYYDDNEYYNGVNDYKKSYNTNCTTNENDFDVNNQIQRDELYRQSLEQEASRKKDNEADEYELYRRINNEDSHFYEENNEYDNHQFYTGINDDDEPF